MISFLPRLKSLKVFWNPSLPDCCDSWKQSLIQFVTVSVVFTPKTFKRKIFQIKKTVALGEFPSTFLCVLTLKYVAALLKSGFAALSFPFWTFPSVTWLKVSLMEIFKTLVCEGGKSLKAVCFFLLNSFCNFTNCINPGLDTSSSQAWVTLGCVKWKQADKSKPTGREWGEFIRNDGEAQQGRRGGFN